MRVLVIGAGGREHALAWALARSSNVNKVFVAPGNSGIGERAAECVPIPVGKTVELADFAAAQKIGLTVIGPEQPLVGGLVDYFQERKLTVFGPTKAAARLEGSKVFAKQIMEKAGVPTARSRVFKELDPALAYIDSAPIPIVVKADGLAGGKGAVVARTREEAKQALNSMLLERIFGEAGGQVVVEEFLEGEEVSILALSDGKDFVMLEPAQDHKRVNDNDEGPNTGGMGAYSPVPMVSAAQLQEIRAKVFQPVISAMAAAGTPFKGVLYAGLMLTASGPKVLEFNARFGDPETQEVLPLLDADLLEIVKDCADGRGPGGMLPRKPGAALGVAITAEGYPDKPQAGAAIDLTALDGEKDVLVFHAGTKKAGAGWTATGGRVLAVVGLGADLAAARERAYQAVSRVAAPALQRRSDIAAKVMGRAAA